MHNSRAPRLRRASAFARKEIVEVLRQPRLLITLVLGPFLVLLIFGLGFLAQPPPLRATLVAPASLDPHILGMVEDALAPVARVVNTSNSTTAAEHDVLVGTSDLAIVIPDQPLDRVRANQRATVRVLHYEFDPFRRTYIALSASSAVDQLNATVLESTLKDLQDQLANIPGLADLDPEVLIRPFELETKSVGDVELSVAGFYSPAVVVLLLQHLAVVFGSLTLVRERALGTAEFFRVSPLSTGETLTGKFTAYLLLGAAIASILTVAVVTFFDVPLRGSWLLYGVSILLVLFASAGLGLLISSVSVGESQAVQYSMLVLLATMFFSGFVLPLDQLRPFAKVVSGLLPAAYGISAVQDVMIRGIAPSGMLLGLGLLGLAYCAMAWSLVGRMLRPVAARTPKIPFLEKPAVPSS